MTNEPKKRSWVRIGLATIAGSPFLYLFVSFVLVSFALGVCITETIVETFWPQWDDEIGTRVAGGIAALAILAFAATRRDVLVYYRPVANGLILLVLFGLAMKVAEAFALNH